MLQQAVKIILRKNNITLVEWTEGDQLKRAWVTPDMIATESGAVANVFNPSAGIPYGVNFAEMITLSATPADVDREFKRRGIWTIADLRARPQDAKAAIQAIYGVDLARVLQAAKHYEDS